MIIYLFTCYIDLLGNQRKTQTEMMYHEIEEHVSGCLWAAGRKKHGKQNR